MKKGKSGVPAKISRRDQSMQRQSVKPLRMPRSLRGHEVSTLTSLPAGRMVPVAAIPLLREDGVRRGQVRLSFEMHETAEILMNAVYCCAKAYFVPFMAFERFSGMDALNRSYKKILERVGDSAPVPFFDTEARGAIGTNKILEYLGLHAASTETINTAYVEAYNTIWNYRAKNRSLNLTLRDRLDKTLAPAFWQHHRFKHIVPDFDQAMIDGEVALNVANAQMPLKGLAVSTAASYTSTPGAGYREAGSGDPAPGSNWQSTALDFYLRGDNATKIPQIFAELQADGITVSLSNIEAAKKTRAFAELREQYNGLDDDYIVDLLMAGISVPEQMYRQPMLLTEQTTVFGLSKRYASDGANLTESVVNGATYVDLMFRLPPITTGGVVMIVAECLPDQLFERQQDPLLMTTDVDTLPEALRDELDPEKVDIVYNRYIDTSHASPDAVFGYEPLHAKWDVKVRRCGGRFFRPAVDGAFDEDRQRLWSVEQANPTISEDFYIATNIHVKPFADENKDPFEVVASGQVVIDGLTVFGGALVEASDNYERVLAKVPTDTIVKA